MKPLAKIKQQTVVVKFAGQLSAKEQDEHLLPGNATDVQKFNIIKEQMQESITAFKAALKATSKTHDQRVSIITKKLEVLEMELEYDGLPSEELFTIQKKNILQQFEAIQTEIRKNPDALKIAHYYAAAAETLKLKMEIIEKKMKSIKSRNWR